MVTFTCSRNINRLALVGALVMTLPACNTFERLSQLGSGPSLSKIEDPQAKPGYQPVSMPMPTPTRSMRNPNSLWREGARSIYSDQRASQVGDLVRVSVAIGENADFVSNSNRSRGAGTANGESMNIGLAIPGVNGLGVLSKALGNLTNFPTVDVNGQSTFNNAGGTHRVDAVNMVITATVTQTLPNGNLVIEGRQQVKVNDELRELSISGIARQADIDAANRITYDRLAEARISYGGKGFASDVQKPRWGQELLDIFLPF